MKKILLSLAFGSLAILASAQTIFNVESPASIRGQYDFEYAVASNSWGVADLTDPANSVVDTLAIIRTDGTSADSLGCGNVTNASSIDGKIAVIYRGDCQFGSKAKHAQDSGAVAVIIINNVPGPPLGMLGGTDGGVVTIPVVMVSQATGVILNNAMQNGPVVVFIGNKIGHFNNDLVIDENEVVRPKYTGTIAALSQSATELEVKVGAWIRNYGVNMQHNIELTCNINFGGNSVYSNSSMVDSLASGDSVYVTLPAFSQATYANGVYDMAYTVASDSTEDDTFDNEVTSKMIINDNYLSRAKIDETTFMPLEGDNYYMFTKNCVAFVDPNASRIGVKGLTFSAVGTRTDSIGDKYVEIRAYEWDGINSSSMSEIQYGEYSYSSNSLTKQNVTAYFPLGFGLVDNQNYLFCVENTTSDTIYFGASEIGYSQSITEYNEYTALFEQTNGDLSFFGDIVPSITIETIPAAQVGVEENEEDKLVAYPNPAKDMISIPVGNTEITSVNIYDVTGKLVASQTTSVVNNTLTLDVTSVSNGSYVISLNYANNTSSKINVVINK